MIEAAYTEGERLGLAIWGQDEAGPYQTIPYPGPSWQPEDHPARQPHEYIRQGTAKLLTLFHPATGLVRVKGVRQGTNAVLHPWLKQELMARLSTLPPAVVCDPLENRRQWERWQEGLKVRITLSAELPPLRLLLIWDNLAGHHTPELMRLPLCPWHHAPVHASGRQLAQYDRIHAAHSGAAGLGWAAPHDSGADH